MRAAILRDFGNDLHLEEIPTPEPKGDELLVRVLGAGVCHTDLHIIDGKIPNFSLPRILGHEISGYVEGVGNVLVYASWGCGKCRYCRTGEEQLCPAAEEPGWARDGGYAEHLLVPSRQYLIPLGELDPVRAAPLADAGLTSFRAVRRVRNFLNGDCDTVVIGAGGLGQFAIQFLKLLTKCRVIAVDREKEKLRWAEELGADGVIVWPATLPPARCILDFVGSDETLAQAASSVERAGVLMVIGEAGGKVPFGLGRIAHESWFSTSIWGNRSDLASVIAFAQRKEITWRVEILPLSCINEALRRLRDGKIQGRVVLTP